MKIPGFDFGRNWEAFSLTAVDEQRIQDAKASLTDLLGPEAVASCSVLDVGCGSGLFSISATMSGASRVLGMDINQRCIDVSTKNFRRFTPETGPDPEFVVGSALDPDFMSSLGQFDLVYAWGSLHHTGDMWKAIENAARRAKRPGGRIVLALYNRHWSCPGWLLIKRIYNISPRFVQALMNYVFGAVIYLAKLIVTRQNPLKKERGMAFWFDIIDWLGGYPFEYASEAEVVNFMARLGFDRSKCVPPAVPTGCNEFVFEAAVGH